MNDGTASSSSSVIHRRRRRDLDLDLAHPPFDESSLVDTPLIQSKHTVPEGATPSSRFDWFAHITRVGMPWDGLETLTSTSDDRWKVGLDPEDGGRHVTPRRRIDPIFDEDDDRVVRRPGGARDGDDGEREIGVRGDVR